MKPPLTNPPPDLERGADYDTPQTYARIGRALMLFLFSTAHDPKNAERMAWLCEGVARTNGAPLFDNHGMTLDPTAHKSHWMNPRGSWGGYADENDDTPRRVEWRCGWCGAVNDTAKAKARCNGNKAPRRAIPKGRSNTSVRGAPDELLSRG